MNRHRFNDVRRLAAACVCLIVFTSAATGDEKPANPFDGKSLDAWTTLDGKPVTQGWEVVDGVIHLRKDKGAPRAGHIVTRDEFGDFRLSFEWKIASRGNSGLKYRVGRYGNKVLGCEYQIYDDLGIRNRSAGKTGAGSLYGLYEPQPADLLRPAGEWNQARIVVQGNTIEHWLNGQRIVSATVGDDEWNRRIARSKFSNVPEFGAHRTGKLMLTDHGAEVWYRNFVFEPLP